MVEGAALEMLCTQVPRVRIPNSPPERLHKKDATTINPEEFGVFVIFRGKKHNRLTVDAFGHFKPIFGYELS